MDRPALSQMESGMTESVEVGLARMQEQMKSLLDDMAEAKQSRKEQYKRIDEIGRDVTSVNHRLQIVETQLASSTPTIAEFVVMKNKIQGAGALGRWLWAFGGFLIGLIAWVIGIVPALHAWFTGK